MRLCRALLPLIAFLSLSQAVARATVTFYDSLPSFQAAAATTLLLRRRRANK